MEQPETTEQTSQPNHTVFRLVPAEELAKAITRAFPAVRRAASGLFVRYGNSPAELFPDKAVRLSRTASPRESAGLEDNAVPPQWFAIMADGWKGLFREFRPNTWIAEWLGRGPVPAMPHDPLARAPLASWRLYLSEEERQVVEARRNGPFMVIGAAGTGKTVVAVHRVCELVSQPDWRTGDKVLLVTYSLTLAEDLRKLVAEILPPETMKKAVEVCALEDWLSRFLKANGRPSEFFYPGDERWERAWDEAKAAIPPGFPEKAPLPEGFYRSEFQQLILPEGVRSLGEYLKLDRRGRSVPLTASQRRRCWPVFEAMRGALARHGNGAVPSSDGYFDAIRILASKRRRPYRAVVVDEGQDFGNDAFRLIRALAPDIAKKVKAAAAEAKQAREAAKAAGVPEHEIAGIRPKHVPQGDIFIAADEGQRIYSRGQDLSRCGINIRARRTYRLTTNYRTTAEIRSAAILVKEASQSKLLISRTNRVLYRDEECISLRFGPLPELYQAKGFEDEADWIAAKIRELRKADPKLLLSDIVLASFSRAQRDAYGEALAARGIPSKALGPVSEEIEGAVCLSTLHRLKGLEFKVVFIAGADRGRMPSERAISSGFCEEEQEAMRKMQKNVFYVASTRARDLLFVTCESDPGEYMAQLDEYLSIFGGDAPQSEKPGPESAES